MQNLAESNSHRREGQGQAKVGVSGETQMEGHTGFTRHTEFWISTVQHGDPKVAK